MDLQELRNEINDIDSQLQELFNKRMQISFKVAEYKIANNMPVFQSKRENEILDHVTESSPKGLESASRVSSKTSWIFQSAVSTRSFLQTQIK